jgi:hypothetical protein
VGSVMPSPAVSPVMALRMGPLRGPIEAKGHRLLCEHRGLDGTLRRPRRGVGFKH